MFEFKILIHSKKKYIIYKPNSVNDKIKLLT